MTNYLGLEMALDGLRFATLQDVEIKSAKAVAGNTAKVGRFIILMAGHGLRIYATH